MSLTDAMEGAFLRFLEEHLDPGKSGGLLIALSGGCDSTALFHLAIATAPRHRRPIVAGHVDHGIRPDSRAEARRLREMCLGLEIPFVVEQLSFDAPEPTEAEMRRERMRALTRIARGNGCPYVLLGHQRDDQAETVILNLTRGAGLRGLAGMSPVRGRFCHPLLAVSSARLPRYLQEIGVPWTEDPTNLDRSRARNRVRHVILPLLEAELRPGASAAIARASFHLRRALDAIEAEAHRSLDVCRFPAPDGEMRLDGDRLRAYHVGWIDAMLRLAVESISGTIENVSAPAWRMIASAAGEGRSGRFSIRGRVVIETSPRVVRIAIEDSKIPIKTEIEADWTGRTAYRSGVFVTRLARMRKEESRLRIRGLTRLQAFDASALSPPIRIRPPRAGDRISLEDSAGRRLLSDLLSEIGIPRSDRPEQPVLEDGGGILWVPGIRRAGRARVGPETERIWIVRWLGPLPVDRRLRGGPSRS